MTIALSVSDITSGIYARSALRTYLGGEAGPAPLHRDHAALLGRVVADAFALTVAALRGHATGVEIDGDILRADFADGYASGTLRQSLEAATEALALSMVWQEADGQAAGRYRALWQQAVADLAALLAMPPAGLRIRCD